MNSKIESHLSFYLKNKISPVKQDISSRKKHFQRRGSLYRYLGLHENFIKDKNILEVGPAEGHNSAFVASCDPISFDLLEPNLYACKNISSIFEKLKVQNSNYKIINKTLEKFNPKKKYDLVICEAWLGISNPERKLMRKLSNMVGTKGILVTTSASPIGFISNIIRRFLGNMIIKKNSTFDEKVFILYKAFSSHLKTLKNMSCPHLDWIKDVLLNPGFLTIHPTPKMIFNDIPKNFNFYNSYPSFHTDWRWYKDLHGPKRNLKKVFLKNYNINCHNFFDYKKIYEYQNPVSNFILEKYSLDLLNLLINFEKKKDNKNYILFLNKVIKILKNFKKIKGFKKEPLTEVISLLKSKNITIEKIRSMKKFKSLFGRELFYLSVFKDN